MYIFKKKKKKKLVFYPSSQNISCDNIISQSTKITCIHTKVRKLSSDFRSLLFGVYVGDHTGRCTISTYNHSLIHRTHCVYWKFTQYFIINFYTELSLTDALLHPKKVKGNLRVDTATSEKGERVKGCAPRKHQAFLLLSAWFICKRHIRGYGEFTQT